MSPIRFLCLFLALCCLITVGSTVMAAEVDCDTTYCFTAADFSQDDSLKGICITQLPDAATGTVMLGNRVIRAGDILTAEQLAKMTFCPLKSDTDRDAVVTYLPIYSQRVEASTTAVISIRGKQDKAPIAEDFAIETYKNLPNKGQLKVSDPEGKALTYSLVRNPKRGEVTVNADGTFEYMPKKNKVGVDSFTYTATDPAGNVSREATVTIQILKPTDARQYSDTIGQDCRFAAEWMRNTGLFAGETVGNEICFQPEKAVSRGEFLAMVVEALDIPIQDASYSAVPADTPNWLRPYLAAAIRSGLTAGLPQTETGSFNADDSITGAEAAVMLQNVLDLTVSQQTLEAVESAEAGSKEEIPTWASTSLTAMSDNGIVLTADETMTRSQVAQLMYQVCQMADSAPGMRIIRMQQ